MGEGEIKGPADPETIRPEDQKTLRPADPETIRPEDQKTDPALQHSEEMIVSAKHRIQNKTKVSNENQPYKKALLDKYQKTFRCTSK